jgi:hypothetical protein
MVPIDEVKHVGVCLNSPSTGAESDADSDPTFKVFEESTSTEIVTGTMTKRTGETGTYCGYYPASAANGFEAGKYYQEIVLATVEGISARKTTDIFRCAPAETVAGVPKVDTQYVAGATPETADNVTDNVLNEVLSGHTTSGTVGKALSDMLASLITRSATAQAGGASTITLDSSASAVDDFYNNQILLIVSGTGAGQARSIADYVGSTKVATVASAWATNPNSSSVFAILPSAAAIDAAGVRSALGMASANLDTQLGDLPTNAELATALGTADDAVLAAIAALNNLSSAGAQSAAAAALAAYSAATATGLSAAQTAILAKLPAALTGNGNLKAAVKEIVDTPIQGDGNATAWGPA